MALTEAVCYIDFSREWQKDTRWLYVTAIVFMEKKQLKKG